MTIKHLPSPTQTPLENWKPRFFSVWTGQAISLLGSAIVQFSLIWHLTQLTNSGTTLATASLAGLLPQVFLSPLIGTLVDRWNRRAIMMVADGIVAFATIILAMLFAFNLIQVWHIYVLMFVRAVGGGFHQSAMGASVVLMVPKENLSRVQGLNHTLHGGLNILSAPLGAFLLAFLPMQGILAIDVSTAAIAILILALVNIPQPERSAEAGKKSSVWQEMWEGFAYVRGWPALVIILGMVLLINFFLTPVGTLLPLLVSRHFQGDALQLGWLEATSSGGMILGGVFLGVWGGFTRRVVTALFGLVGIGVGVILTGLVPADGYWWALGAVALTGVMTPITNGSFGAVLQASIAPEMQGRVFALILSAASAMSPLGLIVAGPLADSIGIQTWFVIGGVVCAGMGVLGFFIPTVMGFEVREGDVSQEETSEVFSAVLEPGSDG